MKAILFLEPLEDRCVPSCIADGDCANADPVTPATTFHGLPGNNPAHGGSSASPNGTGVNGGNGIHDIDQNPGQLGINPGDDGVPGFANQLATVHGGIGAANKNA